MAETVVVSGAGGPVGLRVRARLVADPDVERIVEVDPAISDAATLDRSLAGADVLVLLSQGTGPDMDGTGGSVLDIGAMRDLLQRAGAAGLRRVVVLSTAMVYGAWPNNPVPITEDAALRPVPELPYAVAKAEMERQVAEWQESTPDAVAAILRPTVVMSADSAHWLSHSPWRRAGLVVGELRAPCQFLHFDDLADAVDTARRQHLDGPFNVAPDGWLAPDARRELDGPSPRLQLSGRAGDLFGRVRQRLGPSRVPPGLDPYTRHSWVVANDRLRATGWAPTHTSEEVYVEAAPSGPLGSMSPRRRQELSLAVLGGAIVVVAVGVVAIVRGWRPCRRVWRGRPVVHHHSRTRARRRRSGGACEVRRRVPPSSRRAGRRWRR